VKHGVYPKTRGFEEFDSAGMIVILLRDCFSLTPKIVPARLCPIPLNEVRGTQGKT
jgi:hypothetical protein